MKEALEAENEKTAQMQEAMKKVDIEMKRSDELLAQMIPKAVADKVKKGLNPVDTCEVCAKSRTVILLNLTHTYYCINILNTSIIFSIRCVFHISGIRASHNNLQ